MARSESRFGFGQLAGSAGVALFVFSVSQPWLKLDIATAFSEALRSKNLSSTAAGEILFAGTSGPLDQIKDSPEVMRLGTQLGIGATGWDQNNYLAGALLAVGFLALVGILRSVLARSAWGARANSPFLALAGIGGLVIAALQLWVFAPKPRAAMKPELGLWFIVAGSAALLIGALTLGSNRRREWIDELDHAPPPVTFDNTDHLAYSHGAWIPKLPDDKK